MLADRVLRYFSIEAFQARIDDLYKDDDGKGFYELPGLKFLLFEYEESLRRSGKSADAKISWEDFRGAKNSVEHIYPQTPDEGEWPSFDEFDEDQRRFLTHCLGNLVAVSVAKNASLSRRSFKQKKKGTDKIPGFSQGSFSELEIAQCADWTAAEILDRGLKLLNFIEERWKVDLEDDEQRTALLRLDFL